MLREIIYKQGQLAKDAAEKLAAATEEQKNKALLAMAQELRVSQQEIIAANHLDLEEGKKKGLSKALLDRLLITPDRINDMASGLEAIAALPDPIGEVTSMWTRAGGLQIGKVRVPLGVVGIIYESRPNVTVDAAGLCLKTGNATILRGGSEAFRSNKALCLVIKRGLTKAGIPEGAVQLIDTTDRQAVDILLKMNQYLDVLIPRGGAGLIKNVVENATVPVIETGVGNCHIYVDEGADLEMAKNIVFNAKTQRPGVCNALETLLVHVEEAAEFLPLVAEALLKAGVELRGCSEVRKILKDALEASEQDWSTEYLDYILAIKVVQNIEEAVNHINRYGTGHSEAIITRDYSRARYFQQRVDAAAVYVNASTRFTDGFQFGFGAEIGISTQKLHARGPMGPLELTTYKYIINGDGQIRL
ncbi:MAG: glutamate-5-semialdehyde dehydrogenase [Zhaonellaceae bacterium]|jgi:glutamate-5-semialdehyde dehydrogenase|nr:glutamate-5-semialdehyde dehydrogenase [Clostridia bacterium]